MAGFFSLGGRGPGTGTGTTASAVASTSAATANEEPALPPESWFLYHHRNEDITYKSFELWQQQQQQQQRNNNHNTLYGSGGAGPSSSRVGGPSTEDVGGGYNNMMMMRAAGGGLSCQDCGNQAKKDCTHMRCRTCCKSRGFDCATHVKSTWVPAAKRRERHQQLAALQADPATKRLREHPPPSSSSSLVCTRIPTSGMEVGTFPAEVSSPAVFRCVRVSAIEEGGEGQVAYQTAVSIGGHVFKGLLYDQGPESSHNVGGSGTAGDSSSGTAGGTQSLVAGGSGGGGGGGSSQVAALTFVDPSYYSAAHQLGSFMEGTQFFPNPRP